MATHSVIRTLRASLELPKQGRARPRLCAGPGEPFARNGTGLKTGRFCRQ